MEQQPQRWQQSIPRAVVGVIHNTNALVGGHQHHHHRHHIIIDDIGRRRLLPLRTYSTCCFTTFSSRPIVSLLSSYARSLSPLFRQSGRLLQLALHRLAAAWSSRAIVVVDHSLWPDYCDNVRSTFALSSVQDNIVEHNSTRNGRGRAWRRT